MPSLSLMPSMSFTGAMGGDLLLPKIIAPTELLKPFDPFRATFYGQRVMLHISVNAGWSKDDHGGWRYSDGGRFLLSVDRTTTHRELMRQIEEKTGQVVTTASFQKPGDELNFFDLISIRDDSDVEETFQEYFCSLQKALMGGIDVEHRLRLFVNPWVAMTEEERADCDQFLEDIEAELEGSYGSSTNCGHPYWVESPFRSPLSDVNTNVEPKKHKCTGGACAAGKATPAELHALGNQDMYPSPGRKSVAEWETTSSTSTFLFGDKYSERIAEMRAEEKKKRKVLKYDPRKLPSNISCWARPARPEMRDVQGFLKGTISPVAGQPQQNFRGRVPSLDTRGSFDPSSPMIASYAEYPPGDNIAESEVSIIRRIGEGAYGEVSLAMCKTFGKVAIKWLKADKQEQHGRSFLEEADNLRGMNHPNVLRFYGRVLDHENRVVGIITEYMKGGSLSALVRKVRLPLLQRAELALGAVKGLAYLHDRGLIHYDLKPDNLLLEHANVFPLHPCPHDWEMPALKVADFGLSKKRTATAQYAEGVNDLRGTLPYMAPEVVFDPTHVSEKADVWSMGVCMWEMFTGHAPYDKLQTSDILHGLKTGALFPEIPADCEEVWGEIVFRCFDPQPESRPCFNDVADYLQRLINRINGVE